MDSPPRISVPEDPGFGANLPWFETALLLTLWLRADRAGVVRLAMPEASSRGAAVAAVVGSPEIDRVSDALEVLARLGLVELHDRAVVLRGYHAVQYGSATRATVRAASRAKYADTMQAVEDGYIEPPFWMLAKSAS